MSSQDYFMVSELLEHIEKKCFRHHIPDSKFHGVYMGSTWGPPGSCPQMGPMLAPCTLLSGMFSSTVSLRNLTVTHGGEAWTISRASVIQLTHDWNNLYMLRVRMCRGQNTYTVVGVILYWSYKKPWKTKYKDWHNSYITNYNITITIPFTVQFTQ